MLHLNITACFCALESNHSNRSKSLPYAVHYLQFTTCSSPITWYRIVAFSSSVFCYWYSTSGLCSPSSSTPNCSSGSKIGSRSPKAHRVPRQSFSGDLDDVSRSRTFLSPPTPTTQTSQTSQITRDLEGLALIQLNYSVQKNVIFPAVYNANNGDINIQSNKSSGHDSSIP